jgi:hypothetical protein
MNTRPASQYARISLMIVVEYTPMAFARSAMCSVCDCIIGESTLKASAVQCCSSGTTICDRRRPLATCVADVDVDGGGACGGGSGRAAMVDVAVGADRRGLPVRDGSGDRPPGCRLPALASAAAASAAALASASSSRTRWSVRRISSFSDAMIWSRTAVSDIVLSTCMRSAFTIVCRASFSPFSAASSLLSDTICMFALTSSSDKWLSCDRRACAQTPHDASDSPTLTASACNIDA